MKTVFRCILIIIFVVIVISIRVTEHNQIETYFKSLNLEMTGVLKNDPDCPNGYNGFCVLTIDVIKSNISEYDPRNKLPAYYCIIKGRQAEVYQSMASDYKKGDTVVISTKDRIFQSFRTATSRPILLNTNASWFEYLNEYHQKF